MTLRLRRRLACTAAAGALVLAVGVGTAHASTGHVESRRTAPTALSQSDITRAAAVPGDYLGTGVRIRERADGTSGVLGLGYQGQGATVHCWQDGPATEPNGIVSWFFHRNNVTGLTGWSSWEVFRPVGPLPHC